MIKNRLYLLPVSALILAILACNLPGSAIAVSNPGAVGTSAAQTVAALSQLSTPGSLATDTPVPSTVTPALATDTAGSATLAAATNTPISSPTQICDSAQFISETVPDGTAETAGVSFTKTWRLKNIGACTWNSSYAVVFVSGNVMGASSSVPLSGNVGPGQEVDVAVDMHAPTTPGNYSGTWTLRNASGVLFGLGAGNGPFWIKIDVVAPTATATASGPSIHLPIIPIIIISSTQVGTQSSVPASATGSAVATCPSGSKITGGGFVSNPNLWVYSNFANGNNWEAYAQNLSTSAQLLSAYAECLSNVSGATAQVYVQVTAAANGIGHAIANCPSGSVITGGGFASTTDLVVYSNAATGNGWEVDAQNTTGVSQLLNSYALCLSGASGSTQQLVTQVSTAANGIGHPVMACPSGTYLTGGGYAGNQNFFVYNDSASGSSWQVYAKNNSGSSQLLNSYALCLTLP